MAHAYSPRRFSITTISILLGLAFAASASAQPTFSKSFQFPTIGPGSVTGLTFVIDNSGSGAPVSDLAFTDNLPAGLTIQTPANASTTCGPGIVTAPNGGSTISFAGGSVPGFGSCTVTVDVTASTPAIYMNVSGDLTSSAGNSGTASADLTVDADRPGFSKSFAPSSVPLGVRSTLTFTIDNTANTGAEFNLSFIDPLPPGLEIADPSNGSTTCAGTGTLTADPGTTTIAFGSPGTATIAAGASCTVSVDVVATSAGSVVNVSGPLTFLQIPFTVDSGKATAQLDVTVTALALIKEFTDDPVPAGGTATLEFTILNRDRDFAATGISFTDDLDAALSGLTAISTPLADPCGAGSTLTGTTVLTLSGGDIPPEGSCTFSVTLQVPGGAASGAYTNTTSAVSGTVDGMAVVGNQAEDVLFVEPVPALTKTFLDAMTMLPDPVVGPGDSVIMEFSITNTSSTSTATDIAFLDELTTFLPFPVSVITPANGFCGPGSSISLISLGIDQQGLAMTGGELAAGASCTFQVTLNLPGTLAGGVYTNTTEEITATIDAMTVTGPPASDDFSVVEAPLLQKEFTDDPVLAGGTVTLQFTLTAQAGAAGTATNIAFTDNLDAALSGLVATGLPMANVCGPGSMIDGTMTLMFSGGTLTPGDSCQFSVTLQVPAGASPGSYTNTTSNVTATVLGVPTIGNPSTDALIVAGLTLTKQFTDDPVVAGSTVDLEFTLENVSAAETASAIFFSDNVDTTLTGMTGDGVAVANVCGPGNGDITWLSADTLLFFTGATLGPGEVCTFTVTLNVPGGAADGDYLNVTSGFSANFGGGPVLLPNATDTLTVDSNLLALSKEFTDDPVSPGDTATLRFTLTNLDATQAASAIAFTDDLDAALSGLAATGLPIAACGGTASGTGTITFSGGTLAGGAMCFFDVTVQVPAAVPLGTEADNVTSLVTGTIGGLPVTGTPATDTLQIDTLRLTKTFSGPSTATGTVTLTFLIENLDASSGVSDLGFTDDLDAVITGLMAIDTPQSNVCGMGSTISGTSFLALSDGNLLPGGSCSFNVTLQVPAGAAPGAYPNTTSDLLQGGIPAGAPATDSLTIEPPPTFAKVFNPDSIGVGFTSTLTFTIDNTASALAASSLDFTDNLPAAITVAAMPNASTTCTGGTLTAVPASGVISYTGGSVGAGASCIVQVDVTSAVPGSHVNTTGDLTSSSGNSGTATDTLVVNPAPGFSKAFAPDPIATGGVSTLTFTLDNTASTVAATGLDFTDNLPAEISIATPANASTTCTGGTLTAPDGGGTIMYTGGSVAAGAACTVSVDTTSSIAGTHTNTSGNLTSSLGSSGTAVDTLTVNSPPAFSKTFTPDSIGTGLISTLVFTIDNSGSTVDATGLDFTDNLPAEISIATPANASTTCTGGTLGAPDGGSTISYTGGSVATASSCTISVDVTSAVAGTHTNTSGDLTSSLGNSGPAIDTLTVNDAPLFSKVFAPDSIGSGQVSLLTFTIDNTASTVDATGLDFTDNLPAGVTLATPANPATDCTGGTLTAPDGGGSISYAGGSVGAASTCTITVDVTSSTPGAHVNISGDLTSVLGNSGTATDTLVVNDPPVFSKAFAPAAIQPGEISTLTLTIDNSAATVDATGLDFTDNLPAGVTLATPANPATTCTGGTVTAPDGGATISYTGGTVGAGASCTVAADVTSSTVGTHTNVAGPLTSILGSSGTASADLIVVDAVTFTKAFLSAPVLPGGMVDLEFTIDNPSTDQAATDISFSDDLDAVLAGLVATGLPQTDVCGAGSTLAGTSVVTLSGGSLAAGASCTFGVTLLVPGDAADGFYTNTTSPLSATQAGVTVTSPATSDDLEVAFLEFSKEFEDEVVMGGSTTMLSFTITNLDPVNTATDITFSDDLDAVLPGLMAIDTPQVDVCGAGSQLSGTSVLMLDGGVLGPSESCTFTVVLEVPMDAPSGTFSNITTPLEAMVNGTAVIGGAADAAQDDLVVEASGLVVPTLSTWGLILLSTVLAVAAMAQMRRRPSAS